MTEPTKAQLAYALRNLTDQDECSFDHHGGCQAHNFLDIEPGEVCPVQHAKNLLDAMGIQWR